MATTDATKPSKPRGKSKAGRAKAKPKAAAARAPEENEPRKARGPVRAAVKAMRPKEWIKNLLVFAGLLFSGKFTDASACVDATVTFLAFCAVASAGYLVNDAHDAELDRQHPSKRFRPIAAGELSARTAIVLAAVLVIAGLVGAAAFESLKIAGLVAAYGVGTTLYSYVLKTEVILDVMTIAGLFVLRVLAGAVAVGADASAYLLLTTGMVAMFLGFTKRRQEANSELHAGTSSRPVLEHYSLPFLDQMIAMVTAATVMSYAIYAINSPLIGSKMLGTLPAVVYGLFRYLYLVYDREDERSTASILTSDYGMIGASVVWVATAITLLAIYK